MSFKDILLTANASLLRSKVRSLLTIVAIFVGAFTLTLTSALGAGVATYVDSQLGNLGQENALIVTPKTDQGAPGEPQRYDEDNSTVRGNDGQTRAVLTKQDVKKLERLPTVEAVTPFTPVAPDFIQGANGDKYTLTFSSLDEETAVDLESGSLMQVGSDQNELILPDGYVEALGYTSADEAVNETVQLTVRDVQGKTYTVEATVKAVMAKGLLGASGAVANQTLRNELYRLQTTGLPEEATSVYQAAVVKLVNADADTIAEAKQAVEKMGLDGFTIEDQLGIIKTVISTITYVLNGFALLALLAAGFGIVNTLLMSVQERTKEIGLMKAMGMSQSRIFMLFSAEAIFLGFWGSLLGVGAAALLGSVANNALSTTLLKDLPGFDLFLYPVSSIAFVMVLIMSIAFLSGTLPARRAAKLTPMDALRYE